MPRNGVGGHRSHRPRTGIFDHLFKGSRSFNFLTKDVNIFHGYVPCHWDERWEYLILHEKSGRFGQLQGVLKFERSPAWIEQDERRRKKKQGMDESSTVLEVAVNKTKLSVLKNSLTLTEELWLMIAIISPFSLRTPRDSSSAVAARTTRVRNS